MHLATLERRNQIIRAMCNALYEDFLDPLYIQNDKLNKAWSAAGFLTSEIDELGDAASMMAATRFHNDRRRKQKTLQALWAHSMDLPSAVDHGEISSNKGRSLDSCKPSIKEPDDDPVYLEDFLQT